MKRQRPPVSSCTSRTVLVNNFASSPIRRQRAVSVLRALRLWKRFQVTPDNIKLLAEQADITSQQCEQALDFLFIAHVLRFRQEGTRTFVEYARKEAA